VLTGDERWTFEPKYKKIPYAGRFKCRGLSQWRDLKAAADARCATRLFLPLPDLNLVAIDARDGELCPEFGTDGVVDVRPHIEAMEPAEGVIGTQLLSPAAVINGVVVVTTTANKFKSANSVNGAIRGFDARNGKLRWTFDPLVRVAGKDLEATPQNVGGGNVWTIMSTDSERDLLFLPTASPAPNFWGVHRPGDNRYANSIVALRGSTGKVVWHFQVVHHDVWDRDMASPPIVVDIRRDGEVIPAVIQLSKSGMAFTFNRETGEPLFPIEERPVSTDGIPGEQLSPTQPFTVKPPPLVRMGITPDDAWGFTMFDRGVCRKKIEALRWGPMYEPPTTQGRTQYADYTGVGDSLFHTPGAERGSRSENGEVAAGWCADAGTGLYRWHAVCGRAGAADVTVFLTVYRTAVELARGGRHVGRGNQMEDSFWRTGQAGTRAVAAELGCAVGRRTDRDRRRPDLHRRDGRLAVSCF